MNDDAPADLGRISTVRVSPGAGSERVSAEDWSGRVLAGRYELLREIGRGGMGIVYLAQHVVLRRQVAVKVLRSEFAQSEDALMRFEREARAAAALGSPHIVEVLDFGREPGGEAWMVMELLDGEDLRVRLRRSGPLGEPDARALLGDIARALREAHAKGIVHRDLKSENVILVSREGGLRATVVDFGISKVSEDAVQAMATSRDVLLGTPHYMAPELADPDARVDHRVDLYALGCIGFEALTGRLPYTGRSAVEVLYQHAHAPVPALSTPGPRGARLDAIVRRLLQKRADERYPDASALLMDLERVEPQRAVRGARVLVPAALILGLAALGLALRAPAPGATAATRAEAPPSRALTPLASATPAGTMAVDAGALAALEPARLVAARDLAGPRAARTQRPRRAIRRAPPPRLDAGVPESPRGIDELRPSPYAAGARARGDAASRAP